MGISLLLGMLVGAVLGLTGAGGGILAVPALVTGMGWSMQQAAPVALIAVAGSAALGAAQGLRKNLVRYKAATLMAISGIPFTSAGLYLAHRLSQRWLLGLFALIMLLVATRLLRQLGTPAAVGADLQEAAFCRINAKSGKFDWTWPTGLLLASIGACTGLLSGLLGVGGGFVIVPLLRRFTPLTMQSIVATSLMVIALVGTGGVVSALLRGITLSVQATVLFVLATATGMLVGRTLAGRLPARLVQQIFAGVLLLVVMGLLLKAVMGSLPLH